MSNISRNNYSSSTSTQSSYFSSQRTTTIEGSGNYPVFMPSPPQTSKPSEPHPLSERLKTMRARMEENSKRLFENLGESTKPYPEGRFMQSCEQPLSIYRNQESSSSTESHVTYDEERKIPVRIEQTKKEYILRDASGNILEQEKLNITARYNHETGALLEKTAVAEAPTFNAPLEQTSSETKNDFTKINAHPLHD